MQMQAMKKSLSYQIHLHLQVIFLTIIFMLVGKFVASHFELVVPYDSQTEVEDIFPQKYCCSSHLTGWSNAIYQVFLKLQLWGICIGFLDDAAFHGNASHEEIKVTSGSSLNASDDLDKHFQACWETCCSTL